LGLMDSPNATERLWRPLEGLGTATISQLYQLLDRFAKLDIISNILKRWCMS
jgi:hypothetical protein